MYSSSPNDEAYVDTDSEIFKKYLEIVSDTVIFEGVTTSAARDDIIIGCQNGTYTLEEANRGSDKRSRHDVKRVVKKASPGRKALSKAHKP